MSPAPLPHPDGPTLHDLERDDLAAVLDGEPRYRVDQIWQGLHAQARALDDITNVPKRLRAEVARRHPPALTEAARTTADEGETVKWLWQLPDGARIETVLMHYPDRSTVCVSTQAGCAMACGFCATGQAGFERHLTTGEIVEQYLRAQREAGDRRVSNVVFMGMGEPLANLDRVWPAIERLHGAVGLSARHLTVSTVGLVPGILRLAEAPLPVGLAVSLHAADDDLRNELVPINRRYPLDALVEACRTYLDATRRRLSFEWALIDGVNDRDHDVRALAAIARDLGAHVNLIPLNPTPGYATRGSPAGRVRAFRDGLVRAGVTTTVRQNRGNDIDAACGQLSAAATPVAIGPAPTQPAHPRGPVPD